MLRKVLIILSFGICLIFLSLFGLEYLDKKEGETFYKSVLPSNNIDVDELKDEYEEALGYIEVPDTSIYYPVMQGKDNSYYLKHLPNGNFNKMGSIFLDYRNSGFNDKNTVIYGHNFNNGTMFSDLLNYMSDDFYKAHLNYNIYTSNRVIKVAIFAGFILDATKDSLQVDFSEDEFEEFLNKALEKSFIDSDINVSLDDKIITLCTCARGSSKSRLVIMGKILV